MGTSMIDVFISYSRANRDVAGRLAGAVKRLGYSVWWDEKLPAHLTHEEAIIEQVGAARAAIVIWSRGSAESKWVRAEAECARGRDILIQTSIDNFTPPAPFNRIETASIRDWTEDPDHPGWRKVQVRLVALCGTRQAAPSLAFAPPVPKPVRAGRANRIALATIAASVMTIVTVGGLVLVKGPPAAQAHAAPSITVAAMTMPPPPERRSAGPVAVPIKMATAAADGAAEPPLLFPDSSERALDEQEVAGLSRGDLRLARNEIYARNGRIFRNPEANEHFAQYAWYRPVAYEVALNPVEEANVDLLHRAEAW
jgi:hypothetical protein